jgi:electron transfer flavoprotein beta subunit
MSGLRIVLLVRRLRARPDGTPAPRLVGACDESALRAALHLRAAAPGTTVTSLAAGPAAGQDPVLRWALAAGADRAARIDDPTLESVDYYGLGRVLAAASRHLGAELILCGDRAEDEVQGAVGPAAAEALGVPHVMGTFDLELGGGAIAFSRRESGLVRRLRLKPPGLLAVTSQHAGPTLPAPLGEDTSREGKVLSLDLGTVGLSAPELRHRDRCLGKAHAVRVVRNATLVRDTDDLVARLREDRLLGP